MWFTGAMERILTETMAPIKADIQAMKDDIRVMKDDIQDIKRVQGQVWKLAAKVSDVSPLIPPLLTHSKNHNLCAGAGDNARLEVVPFTNGRDPTKDPVSFCLSPTSAITS
jgi:hypothetical protein